MWLVWILLFITGRAQFTSVWRIQAANDSISFPISGDSIRIDWGDGDPIVDLSQSAMPHMYTIPGIYQIKIWSISSFFASFQGCVQLVGVLQWGNFSVASNSTALFAGCSQLLRITATDQPLFLEGSNLDYMFQNCTVFDSPLSWNTSAVVSMKGTFSGATNFNSVVEFDTTRVTTTSHMFDHATNFDNGGKPLMFVTATVRDMSFMFAHCHFFNRNLNSFVTSNVTNMSHMFSTAVKFNSSSVLTFDTGQVNDMSNILDEAVMFTQNLESWDTSAATACNAFCTRCGLPQLTSCVPCEGNTRVKSVLRTGNWSLCRCPPGQLPRPRTGICDSTPAFPGEFTVVPVGTTSVTLPEGCKIFFNDSSNVTVFIAELNKATLPPEFQLPGIFGHTIGADVDYVFQPAPGACTPTCRGYDPFTATFSSPCPMVEQTGRGWLCACNSSYMASINQGFVCDAPKHNGYAAVLCAYTLLIIFALDRIFRIIREWREVSCVSKIERLLAWRRFRILVLVIVVCVLRVVLNAFRLPEQGTSDAAKTFLLVTPVLLQFVILRLMLTPQRRVDVWITNSLTCILIIFGSVLFSMPALTSKARIILGMCGVMSCVCLAVFFCLSLFHKKGYFLSGEYIEYSLYTEHKLIYIALICLAIENAVSSIGFSQESYLAITVVVGEIFFLFFLVDVCYKEYSDHKKGYLGWEQKDWQPYLQSIKLEGQEEKEETMQSIEKEWYDEFVNSEIEQVMLFTEAQIKAFSDDTLNALRPLVTLEAEAQAKKGSYSCLRTLTDNPRYQKEKRYLPSILANPRSTYPHPFQKEGKISGCRPIYAFNPQTTLICVLPTTKEREKETGRDDSTSKGVRDASTSKGRDRDSEGGAESQDNSVGSYNGGGTERETWSREREGECTMNRHCCEKVGPCMVIKKGDIKYDIACLSVMRLLNSVWGKKINSSGNTNSYNSNIHIFLPRFFNVGSEFLCIEYCPDAVFLKDFFSEKISHEQLDSLAHSLIGLSLSAHILGLHSENFMVTTDGSVFTVDFSHFLQNNSIEGGVLLSLPKELCLFLQQSSLWEGFVDRMVNAYMTARAQSTKIIRLAQLSGVVPEQVAQFIFSRLQVDVTDAEAKEKIRAIIERNRPGEAVEAPTLEYVPFAKLEITRPLGQGAFGRVDQCIWTGADCAIKRVLNATAAKDFHREIEINQYLFPYKHQFVVSFLGVTQEPLGILMELYPLRSVEMYIIRGNKFSKEEDLCAILTVLINASAGVMHLHKHGVIHRDIAARNFLIKHDLSTAICDFGLALLLPPDTEAAQRTMQERKEDFLPVNVSPPESAIRGEYSPKSDVFMFGNFIWELFARQQPHTGDYDLKIKNFASFASRVVRGLQPELPMDWPEEMRQLMKACWELEPTRRPTMAEVNRRLREFRIIAEDQRLPLPSPLYSPFNDKLEEVRRAPDSPYYENVFSSPSVTSSSSSSTTTTKRESETEMYRNIDGQPYGLTSTYASSSSTSNGSITDMQSPISRCSAPASTMFPFYVADEAGENPISPSVSFDSNFSSSLPFYRNDAVSSSPFYQNNNNEVFPSSTSSPFYQNASCVAPAASSSSPFYQSSS